MPGKATYIDGQLSPALSAGFGPQILLDNLPETLQPGSTLFYYNPEEENLLLQQAALKQTGKASFIDGLTPDSKQNLSAAQVEKAILYQNALEYAQANGVQLGEALTQAQVNELDKPMLWYVEQTVPDPSCTATGTATCPTITALMPQIYLPADMQAMSAGGNISGHNVTLNFNQDGNGSILNTGTISATGNLSVDTQSLSNQANVVDIGAIWSKVSGGYLKTSGTQVQPGGFMAAAQMDINAERINAVNDAFQIRKADGSIDREASDALVAQLKANLGLDYTSSTVKDDIHQDFVKEKKGLPTFVVMALAVAASVLTAGAAAGAMGVALANMTLGQAMMTAALSSIASSAVSQVASGQGLNFGKLVMAGAVGAATAGLTHGITFDGSSFGFSEWGQSLKGTNTLANLAGTTSVSGVTQAIKDGGSNLLWQQAVGVIGTGLVSAGVNTAIYGGSFGSALIGNLVSQGAALGANGIGLNLPGIGTPGADAGTILANALAHGALGCAAASATGRDCAGGAIGGATSAIVAPLVGEALNIETNGDRADPANRAIVAALAMLAGSGVAGAFGVDELAAAEAAQNEALNNYLSAKQEKGLIDSLKSCATRDTQCVAKWTSYYASVDTMQQQVAQNCTLDKCTTIANDARAPSINTDANLALCQGVPSCEDLLNRLPAQNVSAQASALSRWNSTKNARAQRLSEQAAETSTGSSIWSKIFGQLSPVDASGAVDVAIGALGSIGSRPTPPQSEKDVGSDLGGGHRAQISYKDGKEVPYGTAGSVRPDFVAADGSASFEVKNYNIATNSSGLINNVAQQAIQRARNLPAGMEQNVVIDVRGQAVTDAQKNLIVQSIVLKSNGVISPTEIQFKTR